MVGERRYVCFLILVLMYQYQYWLYTGYTLNYMWINIPIMCSFSSSLLAKQCGFASSGSFVSVDTALCCWSLALIAPVSTEILFWKGEWINKDKKWLYFVFYALFSHIIIFFCIFVLDAVVVIYFRISSQLCIYIVSLL